MESLNFSVYTPVTARLRNEPLPAGVKTAILTQKDPATGKTIPELLKAGQTVNIPAGFSDSMSDTVRDVLLAAGVPVVQVISDKRRPGSLRIYPFLARTGRHKKTA